MIRSSRHSICASVKEIAIRWSVKYNTLLGMKYITQQCVQRGLTLLSKILSHSVHSIIKLNNFLLDICLDFNSNHILIKKWSALRQ